MKLPFDYHPLGSPRRIFIAICLINLIGFLYFYYAHLYTHSISYYMGTLSYKFNHSASCNLKIDGKINDALKDIFVDVLQKSKTYDCKSYELELNSGGGNLGIALDIGDIIKSKGMTTKVLEKCESSCIYLFISGQMRIASKYSIIGMHQSKDVKSGKCAVPGHPPKDNPNFFRGLKEYELT